MAAGGETHSPKDTTAPPLCAPPGTPNDGTGQSLSCLPVASRHHPLASTSVWRSSNANHIRHALRPMDARKRHPAVETLAEGGTEQADDPANAEGQPRVGEDAVKASRDLLRVESATAHGIGALRDRKTVTLLRDQQGGFSHLRHSMNRSRSARARPAI